MTGWSGSVWQCQVSHCVKLNEYRPAPWKAETLPASICQWNVQYCFFLVSGLLGSDTEPSAIALAASTKHQSRTVTGRGTAQWIITMSCSTAPVNIKPLEKRARLAKHFKQSEISFLERKEMLHLGPELTNKCLYEHWGEYVVVFHRSSCGSRTWSSFTWIYSASGATWLVCKEESYPTLNASWLLPLAPPSWQWADWVYSLSLPSMHW